MDNDEDEDVVFEGSELHKHFENIGMDTTDYLYATRSDTAKNKNTLDYSASKQNSRCTFTIIKGLENPFRKRPVSQLEIPCCEAYFQTLVQSEVLTEDDATFLENCLPCEKRKETIIEFSRQDYYKLLAAGGIFIACFYSSFLRVRNFSDILSIGCILTTLLSIYIINELRKLWDYCITKKTHQQNQRCVNSLLDNCSTFLKLLQKCILIIQEFELVDRGFTLLLPQISFRCTDSPSKTSRHHCPGLRHLTFVSCRKVALMFREATAKLRENVRLNSGIDHESHYLSSVPVEEFGFHFSDNFDGFDIDPLSVSALKSTWQLTCMQMSEYFRRLCLSLHIELYDTNYKQMNLFRTFSKFLAPLDHNLTSILTLLQQSYNFHKNAVMTEANEKFSKDRNTPRSHLKGVKVAVHSLSLHLQAALSRALDIEKELENEKIITTVSSYNTESYDMLSHLLQSIKMELSSCQTCEEESQTQIDNLFNKKPAVPKFRNVHENQDQDSVIVNKNNPIPLFEMCDPISEDQIFEAYISDNESQISDNDEDYFVQREEQKKQKETTKLMLSELQTILTVRADDWKKREKVALAKAKGFDDDSLMNTDEDDDSEINSKNQDHADEITSKNNEEINFEEVTQIFKMEKNEKNIFELENCEDPTVDLSDDVRKEIKRRLQDYSHAPQLDFTASIAALAASRSREMNCIVTDVYSDSEAEENFSDSDI